MSAGWRIRHNASCRDAPVPMVCIGMRPSESTGTGRHCPLCLRPLLQLCTLPIHGARHPVDSIFVNTRRARQWGDDWGADIKGDVRATRGQTCQRTDGFQREHKREREVPEESVGKGSDLAPGRLKEAIRPVRWRAHCSTQLAVAFGPVKW